jgi:hypothetical protein
MARRRSSFPSYLRHAQSGRARAGLDRFQRRSSIPDADRYTPRFLQRGDRSGLRQVIPLSDFGKLSRMLLTRLVASTLVHQGSGQMTGEG